MMRTLRPLAVVAALCAAAALTACNDKAAPAPAAPEPALLRAYAVPPGYERDVRSMLGRVLEGVGRAEVGPGGQLVVVAPADVQAGIGGLVAELAKLNPPPGPPAPVALNYWILIGRPAAAGRGGTGHSVLGPAPLRDVAPALEEIAASQGPMEFGLLERLRLVSGGDGQGRAVGTLALVEQRAAPAREGVFANLQIRFQRYTSSIETQARIDPGKFLVLGQTGCPPEVLPAWARGAGGTFDLYYVVSVDASE